MLPSSSFDEPQDAEWSQFVGAIVARPLLRAVEGDVLMMRDTIDKRVESLELRVNELQQLPARMNALEGQIVQLREEMRSEFSAVRTTMRAQGEDLREGLRAEMRAQAEQLRAQMRLQGDELRREMRALNEQTNVHMRVLHEDVISRLARIEEGRSSRATRRKKS